MARDKAHMSPKESGIFFSVFVMAQFWNIFNARYYRTGRSLLSDLTGVIAGKRRFSDCFSSGFLFIAAVIVLGQVLIVNLAGSFFEVAPLSLSDWCWILVITSPVLILPDIWRTIKRHVPQPPTH